MLSGPAYDSTTARLRFRAVSDGFVGGGGWLVDDLRLEPFPAVDAGSPSVPHLGLAVWPTPGRERVRFAADLAPGSRAVLEIFDARGRRVATPFRGTAEGAWSSLWHPLESGGVPPGVYWARLTAETDASPRRVLVRRFVLLP